MSVKARAKVYELDSRGKWNKYKEFEENIVSITISDGNYIVTLEKEDYFGKLVFLYATARHKIVLIPEGVNEN